MFYRLLSFQRKEDFEEAATQLINHGYEPVGQIAINIVVARQNPVTGQAELAQIITQGFIGETPLPETNNDRVNSPLITA